jgi:hypothetical protein
MGVEAAREKLWEQAFAKRNSQTNDVVMSGEPKKIVGYGKNNFVSKGFGNETGRIETLSHSYFH